MGTPAERVPVTEGVFEMADDGSLRLIGGFSPSAGLTHFPLLDTCPYTGARDVERVLLPARGTLWLWTSVTVPPPGYRGEVPYGFGVVELEGGLRVVGRLTEPDPARLEHGMPVHVVADPVFTDDEGREVVTWAFAPVDPGTATS